MRRGRTPSDALPPRDPAAEPGDEAVHATPPEERDLGFGSVVARESRQRLLNRDGSFNVERKGLGVLASLSIYHWLLTTTWPRFFGVVAAAYVSLNAAFALGYFMIGPEALSGVPAAPGIRFVDDFFFSVQTSSTIGYGTFSPATTAANLLVTLESLMGMLGFALIAGIAFARFSRPTARIIFSDVAVIAPYRDRTGFMFRIVNGRRNELMELEARVIMARRRRRDAERSFHELALERRKVAFLPLAWTIVHPIDEDSPLLGLTPDDMVQQEVEFLILLTGIDESFSQVVHARSSYRAEEVVHNARFADIFERTDGNQIRIDAERMSTIEMLEPPETTENIG